MASSQINNTVHTPATRQPKFPCPHCPRCCFSRAGLKNHVHAMHSSLSQEASSTGSVDKSSPISAHLRLSETESLEIFDNEDSPDDDPMPVDVDFDNAQLPLAAFPNNEYDDYGYNSQAEFDNNTPTATGSSDSESESNIIPSSPQHHDESGPHASPGIHQQISTNDRFLRRVYHDKLNGELIMHFC
jgi:hypothetical protein